MSEYELIDREIEVLGATADEEKLKKMQYANLGIKSVSDLLSQGLGIGQQVQEQKIAEQKAAEQKKLLEEMQKAMAAGDQKKVSEIQSKLGFGLVPGGQVPNTGSFLTKYSGPLQNWQWGLVGIGSAVVIGGLIYVLKNRR